jgi:hypothetical protein
MIGLLKRDHCHMSVASFAFRWQDGFSAALIAISNK